VIATTDAGLSWSLFTTASSRIASIAPDPTSRDVWLGTAGAVRHHNGAGDWQKAFNSYNTGLPWYWIDNMYSDREGNFWMATGEAGASRFDGSRWRNWGQHNAGSEPWTFLAEQAHGLYQDSLGASWLGSNGVGRWDGTDLEVWDWQNTPIFGVTLFEGFAEDRSGLLFAVTKESTVYRWDGSDWQRDPVSTSGFGGIATDSSGDIWLAASWLLHHWDGTTWSELGSGWPLFDMGGVNVMAVAPDDTIWLGTNQGLLRYDGVGINIYDTSNSVIDGDISDSASWSVCGYGNSAIPHYQLGVVAFDGNGDLWVSAISEGAAVLSLAPARPPRILRADKKWELPSAPDDAWDEWMPFTDPDPALDPNLMPPLLFYQVVEPVSQPIVLVKTPSSIVLDLAR